MGKLKLNTWLVVVIMSLNVLVEAIAMEIEPEIRYALIHTQIHAQNSISESRVDDIVDRWPHSVPRLRFCSLPKMLLQKHVSFPNVAESLSFVGGDSETQFECSQVTSSRARNW